jgi:hypothetical protein
MYPAISTFDQLSFPFFIPEESLVQKISEAIRALRTAREKAITRLEEATQLVEETIRAAARTNIKLKRKKR